MPGGRLLSCLCVLALAVAGCSIARAHAPTPVPSDVAPTLVLVNGTLIDGTGSAPVPNAVVIVAGTRIVAAGSAGSIEVPRNVRTIDVKGGFILPGFINAHVHFAFDDSNLRKWAEAGVTTVRDEGHPPVQVAGLKEFRAEASKDPHLARLVSAGSMIAVQGGYGTLVVESPEEARQAVLTEIAEGVDAIKVAMEDGYNRESGLPKLTFEMVRAIVDTAHAHGLPVSAHVRSGAYLDTLLDAGVDDLAHCPYDYISDATLGKLVDRDVYVVPTFSFMQHVGGVEGTARVLGLVLRAGGKVALGNDYGGTQDFYEIGMPIFEIDNMAKSGMTPMQVIQAATINAAHVLRLDKEIGTIEEGKEADILVVGGDPLADLHALGSTRLVVHSGAVIRDETNHRKS